MSPRAGPRRTHLSWSTPREGEYPAGAVRRIWLVGKQSTISNWNTLTPTSFLSESSPRFLHFYCADHVSRLPRQAPYLDGLRCPGQDRSDVVRLLTSSSKTTAGRFARKVFSFHDLPSGVRTRGLTSGSPERYIAVRRDRSRRGGLTESPNGPVVGLSPEIVESAA